MKDSNKIKEEELAAKQKAALEEIAAFEVDEEQVNAVTGGGMGFCEGIADCDVHFVNNPLVPKKMRCHINDLCDEVFVDEPHCGAHYREWGYEDPEWK